jgi:hypothetical protein
VIAGFEVAHLLARLADDARALVPADHRDVPQGHVPGREVIVGVAQAGGDHLHQHLGGAGLVELDLLYLPRPGLLPEHGCACPHRLSLRLLRLSG